MKRTEDKINQVYAFALDFFNEKGFPPSIREICEKCSIKSTASAYSYLEKLKERGLLEKAPLKKRAFSIRKPLEYKSVPIIGTVRAGEPIFAVENLEGYCPLPDDFDFNGEKFALRVQGDSMINAGIYDKDMVIVTRQNTANNGEIVVALVEDSATIKRFFIKNDKIILHPENDTMKDMIFDNVQILGVVKGLMRKF
ncbi:MAG: transcriptional repressor LexA [Clostridia bacterium]|nr:transcriptional repressor LexA [Clostridia bacterium]